MRKFRIAVSGTGFIARQLLRALLRTSDLLPISIYTTRTICEVRPNFPIPELLTGSIDALVDDCDLVIECSGSPIQAAEVISAAFSNRLPVVTMNTEFHVTCGSGFVDKGWLSEAEGDQPGCVAALARDLMAMNLKPLVFGNMKGFLNHNPTRDEMALWAGRHGISLHMVTAFTDGTKLQMEQALIANGLGATILRTGLAGLTGKDRRAAALELGQMAVSLGQPVADYILDSAHPPGVFVTAMAPAEEVSALRYYKMGDGPLYVFERPFHLCALEIIKTVREALEGKQPLINNGTKPHVSIAAIAKRDLLPGQHISCGIGSFEFRGEAVLAAQVPSHVPLGILFNAVLVRRIDAGTILTWDDVDLPDSLALRMTQKLFGSVRA